MNKRIRLHLSIEASCVIHCLATLTTISSLHNSHFHCRESLYLISQFTLSLPLLNSFLYGYINGNDDTAKTRVPHFSKICRWKRLICSYSLGICFLQSHFNCHFFAFIPLCSKTILVIWKPCFFCRQHASTLQQWRVGGGVSKHQLLLEFRGTKWQLIGKKTFSNLKTCTICI